MKYFRNALFACLLIPFFACSSDDSGNSEDSSDTPEFAMTAKVNGELLQMNTPFGNNEASGTIFSYYPDSEYIFLQGRNQGLFGNPEFNLFIKRTDLVVGTYQVGPDTDGVDTHIDMIDNANAFFENTQSGFIKITEIDTVNKTIKGEFEFDSNDLTEDPGTALIEVREGTFNYKYDVMN